MQWGVVGEREIIMLWKGKKRSSLFFWSLVAFEPQQRG